MFKFIPPICKLNNPLFMEKDKANTCVFMQHSPTGDFKLSFTVLSVVTNARQIHSGKIKKKLALNAQLCKKLENVKVKISTQTRQLQCSRSAEVSKSGPKEMPPLLLI